ncbi:hypothetical protein [Paenibacillus gansuensis]|uniref:3-methyladenine DNA glycosylase n=1 Tax=Paenibacillus gansuensis TaxID=306542 RepID=A0ABW5PDX5_9BACL
MTQQTGAQARNQEDRKNNSKEQEEKLKKGQDIEPQAEEWKTRQSQNPEKD